MFSFPVRGPWLIITLQVFIWGPFSCGGLADLPARIMPLLDEGSAKPWGGNPPCLFLQVIELPFTAGQEIVEKSIKTTAVAVVFIALNG